MTSFFIEPKGDAFEFHSASQVSPLRVLSPLWLTAGERERNAAPLKRASTCEERLCPDARTNQSHPPRTARPCPMVQLFSPSLVRAAISVNRSSNPIAGSLSARQEHLGQVIRDSERTEPTPLPFYWIRQTYMFPSPAKARIKTTITAITVMLLLGGAV